MRAALASCLLLLATGCYARQANAKEVQPKSSEVQPKSSEVRPKLTEERLKRVRAMLPGMSDACIDKLLRAGPQALPQPVEGCYKFTAPARMRGLWRNDFEGSEYCEAWARRCPDDKANAARTEVWLEMQPLPAGWEDTPPGGLYAIDFIGRRSVGAGTFGHLGMSRNEVIVDRLISIKLIEPPPRGQMTEDHVEAYRKSCAGKPICMPNSEVPGSK